MTETVSVLEVSDLLADETDKLRTLVGAVGAKLGAEMAIQALRAKSYLHEGAPSGAKAMLRGIAGDADEMRKKLQHMKLGADAQRRAGKSLERVGELTTEAMRQLRGLHVVEPNPLRVGWSREVIGHNIRRMVHEGYRQDMAVAASLSRARRSYRAQHPTGAFPAHLRPVAKNPGLVPMTFGVMPARALFGQHFDRELPAGTYRMHLKGSARSAAEGTVFDEDGTHGYDEDDLYKGVKQLLKRWENGDEEAGLLASDILATLGFEWI